jgi:hypothetical protein
VQRSTLVPEIERVAVRSAARYEAQKMEPMG